MNSLLTARLKAWFRRWLDVRPEATRTRLLIVCPGQHTLIEPYPHVTVDCSTDNARIKFYCPVCGCWYFRPLIEARGEDFERRAG
jgi:hypothetical protein